MIRPGGKPRPRLAVMSTFRRPRAHPYSMRALATRSPLIASLAYIWNLSSVAMHLCFPWGKGLSGPVALHECVQNVGIPEGRKTVACHPGFLRFLMGTAGMNDPRTILCYRRKIDVLPTCKGQGSGGVCDTGRMKPLARILLLLLLLVLLLLCDSVMTRNLDYKGGREGMHTGSGARMCREEPAARRVCRARNGTHTAQHDILTHREIDPFSYIEGQIHVKVPRQTQSSVAMQCETRQGKSQSSSTSNGGFGIQH